MNRRWIVISLLVLVSWGCDDGDGTDGDADVDGDGDADVDGDGDADGDSDGDATPIGPPGSTCSCDSDCEEIEGHEGICVFGICMTRASADCSGAGSSAECAAGSRCWGLTGQEGSICWPDCESYECAGTCDADGSCVATEGMGCDSECGSYCGGGTVTGGIGGACEDSSECGGSAECYMGIGWVEGYCLAFGCSAPGEECGDGGICVAGLTTDGSNVCMGSCAAGCRAGYECAPADDGTEFCYPGCSRADDQCPDGFYCADYEIDTGRYVERCLIDYRCSDTRPVEGDCPEGQVCQDGECIDFTCLPDELLEPNEDREHAFEITEPVEGLQICDGDDDWFSFTPVEEGVLHMVGVASFWGSGNLDVVLGNEAGDMIVDSAITPEDFHEEGIRGPLDLEAYTVLGAPGAETFSLHVLGVRGATNYYDLVYETIPWADGNDCVDAGFSELECTAINASGFHLEQLVIFPVGHPADPYIGNGVFFQNGFSTPGNPSYQGTGDLYARRDLAMSIRYAVHVVQTEFEGTAPLGIGDISASTGETPWGHPFWTHHYGGNVDVSYYILPEYQHEWGNMCYRQICNDADRLDDWDCVDTDGSHGQFGECIPGCGDGGIVDVPRTARFLAALAEAAPLRVFGVDTSVVDDLADELNRLEGEDVPGAREARTHMASANDDSSWVWHFNHIHISLD
jgi:hypothetical protein